MVELSPVYVSRISNVNQLATVFRQFVSLYFIIASCSHIVSLITGVDSLERSEGYVDLNVKRSSYSLIYGAVTVKMYPNIVVTSLYSSRLVTLSLKA